MLRATGSLGVKAGECRALHKRAHSEWTMSPGLSAPYERLKWGDPTLAASFTSRLPSLSPPQCVLPSYSQGSSSPSCRSSSCRSAHSFFVCASYHFTTPSLPLFVAVFFHHPQSLLLFKAFQFLLKEQLNPKTCIYFKRGNVSCVIVVDIEIDAILSMFLK